MERIDLDQPRFTPAQVLQAFVPTLTAKRLENWIERKVIEVTEPTPGRGRGRRWSAAGVIVLTFMARVTALGIGPTAAYSMAQTVLD